MRRKAGLADSAPVEQTFFMDEAVGAKTKLDAVVTVADALWLKDRLKDAPKAKNQIAFADVILINKADLVSPADLDELEARIRAINPYAKVHRTEHFLNVADAGLNGAHRHQCKSATRMRKTSAPSSQLRWCTAAAAPNC